MIKATRIQAGEYLYRGYHIVRASDHYDSTYVHWNISQWEENSLTGGDWYTFDSTNTLADAKWIVDRSIAMKEVA